MYLRLGLSCFIIILYITSTTLAKSNGAPGPPRPGPRHHKRRAIGLSEFLTPPALPVQRNRPPPPQLSQLQHSSPNVPYRHGKILNSLPPPPPPPHQHQKQQQHPVGTTEPPGYFSQFMSWLNPFSGRSHPSSLPTSPLPASRPPPPPPSPQHNYNPGIHNGELIPPPLPQGNQYKPPPEHNLPKPPSPPTGQSYLPPLKGESCNTCNTLPWIPLPQATNVHHSSSPSKSNLPHVNENIDLRAPSPSYEVKPPDFGYGPPQPQNEILPQASNSHQNIDTPISQMQYTSVYTGPIPNPHLYPGAIPPLFKATPFTSQSAPANLIPEVNNGQTSAIIQQSIQGSYEGQTNSNQHQSQSFSATTSVSGHSNLSGGYVDALPPSAEVVSGPEDLDPGQSEEFHHDNGGSSSNFEHVLRPNDLENPLTVSVQPIIDGSVPTEYPQAVNYQNNEQQSNYGTKISSDGQHIIHIEESPVIDLTKGDGKSDDASVSSSQSSPVIEETSVILQNPDGTYGINATIPHSDDSTYIRWPLDSETEFDSTTLTSVLFDTQQHGNNDQRTTIEVDRDNVKKNEQITSEESTRRNISSLLLGVFQNTDNLTEHKENVYGTHLDNINVNTHEKHLEINSELHSEVRHSTSTEEPFLEALVKSHREFLKQEAEAKRNRLRLDPRDLQLGSGFSPSFGVRHRDDNKQEFVPVQTQNLDGDQVERSRGGKRNKQVQIIIPYTSQYTPSPFHPSRGYDGSKEVDKTRGRKVPEFTDDDLVEDTRNGSGDRGKLSHIIQTLDSWPKVKDATAKLSNVKANTSIDVLRLQKNIDNWTIQEYSKGTTISTVSPISSHPHLSQSKKIPDEYFTTTEPVSISGTIREIEKTYGNVLAGFNYNDLEHEVSASSRVDSPSIRVSSFEREDPSMSSELDSTTTPTTNSLSAEEDSWEQLPVSISPLSNERVYVVTPQSVSISSRINNSTKDIKEENIMDNTNSDSTEKIVSNERAYQVLPEAVNNLAVVSTGPGTIPLWGIMEHEKYALASDKSNATGESPILYSGHSKVSHTKQ